MSRETQYPLQNFDCEINVSSRNLLTKEWCNLIFEGRNKDYGAYQIRKNMGRRYFVALVSVFLSVSVFVGLAIGLRYWVFRNMEKVLGDWEKEIPKMKMSEAELGHEIKVVSGGRPRPRLAHVDNGTARVPEIVELTKNDIKFGIDEEMLDEDIAMTDQHEMKESLKSLDSVYKEKKMDLPLEAPPLMPTEVVEAMPQFPGGIGALMKWLDQNVVYPSHCVRMKIGGELQVTFYVDIDGTLREPKIVYSLHPDLDRAVLNAIRRMPKWIPGKVNGRLSVVSVTLPVHFQPR